MNRDIFGSCFIPDPFRYLRPEGSYLTWICSPAWTSSVGPGSVPLTTNDLRGEHAGEITSSEITSVMCVMSSQSCVSAEIIWKHANQRHQKARKYFITKRAEKRWLLGGDCKVQILTTAATQAKINDNWGDQWMMDATPDNWKLGHGSQNFIQK